MHNSATSLRASASIDQRLNKPIRSTLASAIILASCTGLAPQALAQNAVLEEVVVTARKQEENAQDVPVSIQTIGSEQLQESNITNLEELSFLMPNVTVSKSGADDNLFIRGVGSGVNLGFERSVGTYVDGLYLGRGKQSRQAFLDLQRVEVLKGPQGVLFGKNTIGGAINITSATPTEDLSGYIDALYEPDANEIDTRFAISNSLTDTVRGRLAGRYHTMDGYLENVYTGDDEPEIDEYALRGTLVWDATEALEVTLRGEYAESEEDGSNQQLYRLDPDNPNNPIDGRPYSIAPVKFDDKSDLVNGYTGKNVNSSDLDSNLVSLTLNYQVGIYTLTSITGYSSYDAAVGADADNSALDTLVRNTDEDFDQVSQELRVLIQPEGAFEYMAGIYYEETELDVLDVFDANLLPGAVDGLVYNDFSQEAETAAAFGQVTWNITEAWRWNVGVRYSHDDKEYDKDVSIDGTILLAAFADDYTNSESRSNDEVTWNSSLQFYATDNLMLYGTVGTGYKDGGFDQFYLGSHRLVDPQQESLEFEEETVVSAEFGMKSTLLDGAMTLNLAAFRSEYDDLQTSALVGATFAVSNAGEAVTQGIEMDMRYAITHNLTMGAAVSWLDAYYDEFTNAACTVRQQYEARLADITPCVQDLTDADLQYAPEWSGNLNVEWAMPITNALEFKLRADVNYSDSFFTAQDEDPFTEADSFTKINLRLALAEMDGSWEVALVGKNLTDEETTSWINDVSNNNAPAPLTPAYSETYWARTDRPRTVALQGIYRF